MSDDAPKPMPHSMSFFVLGEPEVPIQGEAHLQTLLDENRNKLDALLLDLMRSAYRCGVVQSEYARAEWAKTNERRNARPVPFETPRPARPGPDLVLSAPVNRPTLTVDTSDQWYTLYVADPDGLSSSLPFSNLEGPPSRPLEGPPSVDHRPNPAYVEDYARRKNLALDPVALGMMRERWRTR